MSINSRTEMFSVVIWIVRGWCPVVSKMVDSSTPENRQQWGSYCQRCQLSCGLSAWTLDIAYALLHVASIGHSTRPAPDKQKPRLLQINREMFSVILENFDYQTFARPDCERESPVSVLPSDLQGGLFRVTVSPWQWTTEGHACKRTLKKQMEKLKMT